jgi:hypothetical protein
MTLLITTRTSYHRVPVVTLDMPCRMLARRTIKSAANAWMGENISSTQTTTHASIVRRALCALAAMWSSLSLRGRRGAGTVAYISLLAAQQVTKCGHGAVPLIQHYSSVSHVTGAENALPHLARNALPVSLVFTRRRLATSRVQNVPRIHTIQTKKEFLLRFVSLVLRGPLHYRIQG